MSKLLDKLNQLSRNPAPVIQLPPPAATAPPAAESPPAIKSSPAAIAPPAAKAPKRPIRCSIVQDGHSVTEQAIYQALWDGGRPLPDGDRLAALSIPALSRRSGIHVRNVATILQRLIDKLAVSVEADERCRAGAPRVYRVRSYSRCLELRAKAGLEWVLRGRLVVFVDPQNGAPILTAPPAATAPPATENTANFAAPPAARAGDPLTPEQGPPPAATAPPSLALVFKTEESRQTTTTTTTDIGILQDTIEDLASRSRLKRPCPLRVDDDAAGTLNRYRTQLEATTYETAYLLVEKLLELQENKGLDNPLGLLLSKPGTWHTSRALNRLREKRAAEQAEHERIRKENEEWEAQHARTAERH